MQGFKYLKRHKYSRCNGVSTCNGRITCTCKGVRTCNGESRHTTTETPTPVYKSTTAEAVIKLGTKIINFNFVSPHYRPIIDLLLSYQPIVNFKTRMIEICLKVQKYGNSLPPLKWNKTPLLTQRDHRRKTPSIPSSKVGTVQKKSPFFAKMGPY